MKLSIAEGLYLIALDDEEGRLLAAAEKTYIDGILSAIILELYLQGKIGLADGNIRIKSTEGTGNGILDNVLTKLKDGEDIVDTIKSLHGKFNNIQEDFNNLLVQRGILKREATKLMWIPLSERMDNANYAFEKEIRNILQAIVLKGKKPEPEYAILLSLIYDCNILDEVFKNKDDMIDAVKVAKDMVNSPELDPELSTALKELKSFFLN
jgi:hypothetical protein